MRRAVDPTVKKGWTWRAGLVRLHRWFGLAAALFLAVAGLTGAVISWDHELDAWLNPQLYVARSAGAPLPPLALAAHAEAADPRVRVTFMPLALEPGDAFVVSVQPRIDPASGQPFAVDYNQVALDPATGAVQGRRFWGAVSLSRENLLPFLYKLHYSLHIPAAGGIELGIWLMGLLAIGWVVDTLVALWLSFPNLRRWRQSFALRWRDGGHRLVFDLHRSGGVWLFALVLMLAITSVAMNLREPVLRPVVNWFSATSPSPFASRAPAPPQHPIEPRIDAPTVVEQARRVARQHGIDAPPGGLWLSTEYGVWGVGFHRPGASHGDGGLGNPWLYFDSVNGAPVGADIPGTGSAGDLFMQAMFPLHSGRILGLPGRVLISLMGLAVTGLSVTGVWIWWRKQRARARTRSGRLTDAATQHQAEVNPRFLKTMTFRK